ncbi:S24/S26 family peptidase [Nocardioides sp. GY 10127]|uniref:S24/S26 family peptidase n=1 Tax=Nocardioides sp. GY 10127 TaxID=2569762 RepID=UPI0010A80579|nr:S24/S26 family peptidase [Nocardioides sp. GY 10127]TIC84101.1 peptidase S24 [Nocardioides sp. GY 10127]
MALVRGESMTPTLRPGDRLLVGYRRRPVVGDVVVARLADGTVAVKRAVERRTTVGGRPGWWLLSDAPALGVDSRHRGPVPDEDVLAVVLARLWPRPTRRLPAPLGPTAASSPSADGS